VFKVVVVVSRADSGVTGVLIDLGVCLLVDLEVEDEVSFRLAITTTVTRLKLAGC
jgi:hypothetical protein